MDMFDYHPEKIMNLGMEFTRRAKLKDSAVPDVHVRDAEKAFSSPAHGAFAKRRKAEVLVGALEDHTRKISEKENINLDLIDTNDDHGIMEDLCTMNRQDCATDTASFEKPMTVTKSVQVSIDRKPAQRTRRIQVRPQLSNSQVSRGIQCSLIAAPPLRNDTVSHSDDDSSDDNMDWDDISSEHCTTSIDGSEYDSDIDSEDDDGDDDDDVEDDMDMNYKLASDNDISSEKQFLVSESALNKVLSVCRTCGGHCENVVKFAKGTMVCVASVSSQGHVFEWKFRHATILCHGVTYLCHLLCFLVGQAFQKQCKFLIISTYKCSPGGLS
ncbi:uncharacterized protein LOC117341233 [Pecten maximus]|uniref:uncharacterized protein LOC117341233 n=1 Tax=Pecten maximus TaxID=6579 RepID=UPI0014582E73|nr:uncharacterized protein LOC117341233 [Pecten maximus]